MENVSLLSMTLAGILAGAGATDEQAVISTYVLPEIAGLWELDLSQVPQNQTVIDIEGLSHKNSTNFDTDLLDQNTELDGSINEATSRTIEVLPSEAKKTTATTQANALTQPIQVTSPCRERYNFSRDNAVTTTSGAEWTYGNYVYQHQDEGLPVLFINTTYDNNQVDCSGNQIDQTGETIHTFVDYDAVNHQMRWCRDADGKDCFMQFHRLLP